MSQRNDFRGQVNFFTRVRGGGIRFLRTRDRASKGDKKWKRDASYLLRSGRHSIYWDEREREREKIEIGGLEI